MIQEWEDTIRETPGVRHTHVAYNFSDLVEIEDECWLWRGTVHPVRGTGMLAVGSKTWWVHRLAYTLAFGPIGKESVVQQTCGSVICLNPSHLILTSKQTAYSDLSVNDILEIRRRYKNGATTRQLAKEFGVHHSSLGRIIRRETWKDLK